MSGFTPPPAVDRGMSTDGTLYMAGGTMVALVAAYIFQLAGGRVLGTTEFAPVTALWTIQLLVVLIVMVPVEQLTIRRLALDPTWHLGTDLKVIGGVVVLTALVVGTVSAVAVDQFFAGSWVMVLQAVLIVIGYAVFAFGRGRLAGRRAFHRYGYATAAESFARLFLAVPVLIAIQTAVPLGWTMVAAPWIILALRPFGAGDQVVVAEPESAGGFLAAFILANGAAQIILAAGPLVVGAIGGAPAEVSVFFVTFTLLRSPLAAAYGMVARVLPPLSRWAGEGRIAELRLWATRIVVAGLALTAAGWAVGYALGPFVVELLFGSEFRPSASLAALAAAGVVSATASLFVGQILVARGTTGRLATAWFIALLAAAVTVAVASGEAGDRVGAAFLVGEVVALLGIGVAARSGVSAA